MILSLLPRDALYALALLCKRLHLLALPIFLSKFNLGHAEQSLCLNHVSFSAIRGLRTALFISTLDSLEIGYSNITDGLLRFMSRMSKVSSVTLISDIPSHIRVDSPDFKLMSPFFNALAEKSCHRLSISGNILCSVQQRDRLQSLLQTLHTATLLSGFLFSRPFKFWTIRSLNFSPIYSLHLGGNADTLRGVLRYLVLPALRKFQLTSRKFPPRVLDKFLARHPEILSLKLHQKIDVDMGDQRPPVGYSSGLKSLTGDVSSLTYLLSRPEAMPALQSVRPTSVYIIRPAFSEFLKKLAHTPVSHLAFCLVDDTANINWLERGLELPTVHIHVPNSDGADPKQRAECGLTRLTSMEVRLCFMTDRYWKLLEGIPGWLALFPALTSVSFLHFPANLASNMQSESGKAEFVKAILSMCPLLEEVTFTDDE